MGALIHHITGGAEAKTFQPMNVNLRLFRPMDGLRGGRRDAAKLQRVPIAPRPLGGIGCRDGGLTNSMPPL